MADKKMSPEEEIAALKAELAGKNAILENAAQNNGRVSLPVAGHYNAKWKDDATGKNVQQKIAFQDGVTKVRIADGRIVASEAILKIANGEAASPAHVLAYPALRDCNQANAQALLLNLAKMGASFLK